MNIEFKINEFEGPLDLLLHLIKESKMDIMNIEIENITKQYIEYLNSQEKLNLEIASEYLVLASELLEIKSKMLLPNQKSSEEEEEGDDPREELVSRLLEYQAYKEITKVLQEKENLRKEIYTKLPENYKNYIDESKEINVDVSLDDLVDAFKRYLVRKKDLTTKNAIISLGIVFIISLPNILFVIINKFDLPQINLPCATIPRIYQNRFEELSSIFCDVVFPVSASLTYSKYS